MLKKLTRRLLSLLFFWISLVDSLFFGNSCGCQQTRSVCPPPPVCGGAAVRAPVVAPTQYQCPSCDCRVGGSVVAPVASPTNPILVQSVPPVANPTNPIFVQGISPVANPANPVLVQGIAPQQVIAAGGGTYPNSQIISANGPRLISGPQLISGPNGNSYQFGTDFGNIVDPQANYLNNPNRGDKLPSFFTTPRTHIKHLTRNSIEDVYDEVLPTSGHQVADVSVDSKKFTAYDVYLKRNRFLRQLRNRALRQFSAKSVTENSLQFDEKPRKSVCNDDKLAKVMQTAMVDDITVSKKLIRKATSLAFEGKRFDVLCAVGNFSYSVYAKQYCETTMGNVTCFAFI